ncbi:MAG TPA: CinA family protein [Dermatophilaceae bacterium]|nr:CinA family protein [Dermatophilaceae bacterium]
MTPEELTALAAECLALLRHRGETLGCAESLTGGALAAAVVSVPGASLTFRGAVVSYAVDVKIALLGVDAGLIARCGTVDPRVVAAMAEGVCRVVTCDWGVATTGVAGPGPAEGKEAGTAYVAVCGPAEAGQQDDRHQRDPRLTVRAVQAHGGRDDVRATVVEAALSELRARLEL